MQTGNTNYIYRNYLDKACFQYDVAYGNCKDLVTSDPEHDGYQSGLVSMV